MDKPRAILCLCLLVAHCALSSEVYDVTTIFWVKKSASGGTTYNSGEVIAGTNARALPLRRGSTVVAGATDDRCCDGWDKDGWRKLPVSEAQGTRPLLDPAFKETAQAGGVRLAEDNSWRGKIRPGERLRVDWTPPRTARGFLVALFCDGPSPRRCVGIALSGQKSGRLRFLWSQYGQSEDSGPFWVPGSQTTLRATVLAKNDSVSEVWDPVKQYTFQLELSSVGQLRVRLDGSEVDQDSQKDFNVPLDHDYFFIGSYKEGKVEVQADPAWRERLDSGTVVPFTWTPSSYGPSHFGAFFCTSTRQDSCYGVVVSGSDGKGLRSSWARYGKGEATGPTWVPGRLDDTVKSTVLANNQRVREGWGESSYNFTVSLTNGKALVGLAGAEGSGTSYDIPSAFNVLVLGSYRSKGKLRVRGGTVRERQGAQGSAASAGASEAWPVWALEYGRSEGTMTGPAFPMPPQHQLCVLLVAKVPVDGRLQLGYRAIGQQAVRPIISIAPGNSPQGWETRREVIDLPLDIVRRNDKLQLVLNATTLTDATVHVQIIDFCHTSEEHEIFTFTSDSAPSSRPFGFDVAGSSAVAPFKGKTGTVCKHGGVLDVTASRCRCPPGFRGLTCERGCGNNQIGADCKLTCSHDSSKGCQGQLVCGPGLPCKCAPGYQGEACDRECAPTKYGPNCQYQCGRCANGVACDRFTGRCPNGCRTGFQPPLCHESCGSTDTGEAFVIEGIETNITSYPWFASIYAVKNKKIIHICGGTLIKPNLVLTAAHCVTDNYGKVGAKENYRVAFGKSHSAWNATETTNPIKARIEKIKVPDVYRGLTGNYFNDIAILVLEEAVGGDTFVLPACLNWQQDFEIPLSQGVTGTVVGFGETVAGSGQSSKVLYRAEIPVVNEVTCSRALPATIVKYLGPDRYCAGFVDVPEGTVSSVAHGDSGGGLTFRDKRGTWFVRGLVSVGVKDKPLAIFTDVNYHRDFLTQVRDQTEIEAEVDKGAAFGDS